MGRRRQRAGDRIGIDQADIIKLSDKELVRAFKDVSIDRAHNAKTAPIRARALSAEIRARGLVPASGVSA